MTSTTYSHLTTRVQLNQKWESILFLNVCRQSQKFVVNHKSLSSIIKESMNDYWVNFRLASDGDGGHHRLIARTSGSLFWVFMRRVAFWNRCTMRYIMHNKMHTYNVHTMYMNMCSTCAQSKVVSWLIELVDLCFGFYVMRCLLEWQMHYTVHAYTM